MNFQSSVTFYGEWRRVSNKGEVSSGARSIDLWCFLGCLGSSELENKFRTLSKAWTKSAYLRLLRGVRTREEFGLALKDGEVLTSRWIIGFLSERWLIGHSTHCLGLSLA